MSVEPYGLGLVKRACRTCRWRGHGSAGERCPGCGAWSEDYGPIFYGRERRIITFVTRVVDGVLVEHQRGELLEFEAYDWATAFMRETWVQRSEPWNRAWLGPPARD